MKKPKDIMEASTQVAALPPSKIVTLPDGRHVEVCRLNWLQFESVWIEVAGLLTSLLAADADATEESVAAELNSAPSLVLKFAGLCTGISEEELSGWQFDFVLAVAAEAMQLNFIDSKGLRDFFSAASKVASQEIKPS